MKTTILSTSDVHGYFLADDFRRPLQQLGFGLAKAATVIRREREQAGDDELVITIENGDFIQGSPLTNYIEKVVPDEAVLYNELAEAIGYDVRILGNHEFNYGRDYLEKVFAGNQTLLNANIVDEQTQQPFIGEPYRIFEKNDERVAVIGITTQYIPLWEKPENIRGLRFLDPVTVVRDLVTHLQGKVNQIVVAYHGGFNRDLASGEAIEPITVENQGTDLLAIDGVDALVTGHQHRTLADLVDGKPATQPGYRGDHVGRIILAEAGKNEAEILPTAEVTEDSEISRIVEPMYQRVNAWLDKPVGHVGTNMRITDHFQARLYGHPFTELVNQVQMAATGAQISANAIFNDEMRGLDDVVTVRGVMTNYIYPNTLVVEKLTGAQLLEALENNAAYFDVKDGQPTVNDKYLFPKTEHYNYDIWSGVSYTLDLRKPQGSWIQDVQVAGKPLDLAANYEVVINNYRAGGAGNAAFSHDKIVREVQTDVAELIANYLLVHPQIQIDQPTNVKVLV